MCIRGRPHRETGLTSGRGAWCTVAPVSEPRLLVVDDEPDILLPIRRFFEKRGYVVQVAESIEAAVQAFEGAPADVALLDYSLPDGNGLELLKRLRDLDPSLPCVM